ncbi:EAL domain-containing response regulator [Afipia birgiae]|jgi:EAL domain-containing protein (putative c-di-GMP-specific phosphodiesterase class I)/CheY-like chemotaxis protein|uniref:EAL domain-containing response regulator n=1 Tax=Afipia birgiae TaxID=151414 RepID=UPI0002D9C72E|nr:EAL domain-containing response regulator [Afipia birgiae]MBX9822104.1 EAL domain-containing protein [Afipia birgiae]
MRVFKPAEIEAVATFGQRKMAPRVCIIDPKRHIRTFLAEALDELGFIASECAAASELPALLERQLPDLIVLGMPNDGVEAGNILKILVTKMFDGQVLLIGPRDSIIVNALRQLGEETGIAMLPPLTTPFSADGLRASVATLLPQKAPPSPPVDVAEALKAGWLELWYQQKIDVHTLAPRGAEALIRMRHPAWGVVPPASFVPDSKDPQFKRLSDFVVSRALEDWHYFVGQHGPVDISINLPIGFLEDPASVSRLCRQIPDHPAFGGLIVEIKGAEIIRNLDLAIDAAKRMRFHNIAISIDDLGVDWPSLSELKSFPFVEIKVDREYVTDCADNRLKQTVCRSILELADKVGARTVAKGVETRSDLVAAHEMGFDQAQGYLFGKPANAKKFARSALSRPVTVLE